MCLLGLLHTSLMLLPSVILSVKQFAKPNLQGKWVQIYLK